MRSQKNMSIRLAVVDGKKVEDTFSRIGRTGEQAFERIERSTKPASVGLKAVDTTARALNNVFRQAAGLVAAYAGISGIISSVRSVNETGMAFQGLGTALETITGSSAGAREEMKFLEEQAERLGLNLLETAQSYMQIAAAAKGTELAGDGTRQIFTAIAEASTVLQLSVDQTNGALRAIGQIMSKGKALPSCGYNTAGSGPTGSGLVLLSDGTLWSAGFNGNGELGLGDTTQRTSFTQIALPTVIFTDIFVGDGRYASGGGITDQGEVYLWGYNGYGQMGTGNSTNQSSPQKPAGSFQGSVTKAAFGGGCSYEGCILQAGNDLWGAGYSGNANLGINSFAATNNTFQRVLGQSGVIEDWNCYGQGTASWGIGVLYDDGRVDACGDNNSYGETGTQVGNLHDVATLTNVIF